ncbi:winged helix-turn-helix domain-containing protein [Umezawaea endophytica]|uniref:Response regulator transcription factor n=1 Tax=Umezawaea endophytica TaxID=1654476 RepID=A0A9X2VIU0_9PSEU|nr:response regulator transcription factor [Umezawaea endophytica]MCS7475868.1 response regulator transcription factor [Umezawaea endophytica]
MPRVLLVEDDEALAEALALGLGGLGHRVEVARTGAQGLAALFGPGSAVEVVLLDVMLPDLDGFEVCRRIRAKSLVPVLMLTARGDPVDVVVGLEGGADDYVVKPAEPRVLDARMKAVLRRATAGATAPEPVLRFGALTVDPSAMLVTKNGVDLRLTATELRLLIEFARHPGQVLSRQVLLKRVWDYGYVGDSRIVDATMARLRAKVEDDPVAPALLLTVRGFGYRLVPV